MNLLFHKAVGNSERLTPWKKLPEYCQLAINYFYQKTIREAIVRYL